MSSPVLPVYSPPSQKFVRGEGVYMYTQTGERYLDFIAGIAVNALGHCHPALVRRLQEQAATLWHTSNMFAVPGQESLAQRYVDSTFADRVFFTNSGTEAIECALKMARRFHFANGEPDRIDIIGFSGSFHGRTYAAVNASGNATYLEGFGPPLPGYIQVPAGDHDALKAVVTNKTAAILVEPVQGEGGVRALPAQCLQGLRALCDELGILLIFDEVQCGAGRTGKAWAYEWAGIAPDIMAAAKGIGGGFPLGACLATERAAKGMVRGTHGTTYGGNPLAMAVGHAVLDVMEEPGFLDHVLLMGDAMTQAFEGLRQRHPDKVLEMRGKGLLRGIKLSFDPKHLQTWLRDEAHVLTGVAGDHVLRLAPPLIVEPGHISQAIEAIDQGLSANLLGA